MPQDILYTILWGTKLLYLHKLHLSSYFGWNELMLFLCCQKFKFSVFKYFMLTTCTFLSFLKNSCDDRSWSTASNDLDAERSTLLTETSFHHLSCCMLGFVKLLNVIYTNLWISFLMNSLSIKIFPENNWYGKIWGGSAKVISVPTVTGKELSLGKSFRKGGWGQSIRDERLPVKIYR